MMHVFPRSFCAPAAEVSFTPLFRLLDDFDSYSREVQRASPSPVYHRRQHPRRHWQHAQQLATFNPRFDVRETETAYELHGELPGLERENVNIEFKDAQTLVVRGRVERSYGPQQPEASNNDNTTTTTTSPAEVTATNTNAVPEPSTTESEWETVIEKPRRSSHQATVEDDPEDENTPSSTPAVSPKQAAAQPAAEQTETVTKTQKQTPAAEPRYFQRWERSVGEFSRVFTFPARIDHDGVTASLNNGVLSVTVPKAKNVSRRIEITF